MSKTNAKKRKRNKFVDIEDLLVKCCDLRNLARDQMIYARGRLEAEDFYGAGYSTGWAAGLQQATVEIERLIDNSSQKDS